MNKWLHIYSFLLLLFFGTSFIFVSQVFGQEKKPEPAPSGDNYGLSQTAKQAGLIDEKGKPKGIAGKTTIPEIAGAIVAIGLSLLGIVFFGLILYAGIKWMIARGNTEEIETSKTMIEGAVIGLVLVVSAYAITRFVFTALVTGQTDISK